MGQGNLVAVIADETLSACADPASRGTCWCGDADEEQGISARSGDSGDLAREVSIAMYAQGYRGGIEYRLCRSSGIADERANNRADRAWCAAGVAAVEHQPFNFKEGGAVKQVNPCMAAVNGPRAGSCTDTRHRIINAWCGDHANDAVPANHGVIAVKRKCRGRAQCKGK